MYKSPIIIDLINDIAEVIQRDQETTVMTKVKMFVDVDKDELIKALRYDRDQYDKGYNDGFRDGLDKAKSIMRDLI